MKNGGILGVTNGVEEAAEKIGWDVRVLDGAGSVQGRTAAFGQAMALQPDGIIINGFDAVEQQAALDQVAGAKIPMVSWHSGPKIGCDAPGGIFANVSTDAMTVSEEAANWAVTDAGGKPGVVIFTDSTYQIAIDKADRLILWGQRWPLQVSRVTVLPKQLRQAMAPSLHSSVSRQVSTNQ